MRSLLHQKSSLINTTVHAPLSFSYWCSERINNNLTHICLVEFLTLHEGTVQASAYTWKNLLRSPCVPMCSMVIVFASVFCSTKISKNSPHQFVWIIVEKSSHYGTRYGCLLTHKGAHSQSISHHRWNECNEHHHDLVSLLYHHMVAYIITGRRQSM